MPQDNAQNEKAAGAPVKPGIEIVRRVYQTLREKGYRPINECNGPKNAIGSRLVFYAGPRGLVIVQEWTDGSGATTYADWPLGHTWEELESEISSPVDSAPKRVPPIEAHAAAALFAACEAWEFARKEGGISHADFFEAAWKKTETALQIARAAGGPRVSLDSLDDETAEKIGALIAEEFHLQRDEEHADRWETTTGTRTNKGVAWRIASILRGNL